MNVEALDVIEVYKQKLAQANHEIAILTAQVNKLQNQEASTDDRTEGGNGLHGRPAPE